MLILEELFVRLEVRGYREVKTGHFEFTAVDAFSRS
jgi:hypothetical protein